MNLICVSPDKECPEEYESVAECLHSGPAGGGAGRLGCPRRPPLHTRREGLLPSAVHAPVHHTQGTLRTQTLLCKKNTCNGSVVIGHLNGGFEPRPP